MGYCTLPALSRCAKVFGNLSPLGALETPLQCEEGESEYAIGQVGISIKDKSAYFDLENLDYVYTRRKSWFYLKDQHVDGQQFGLAPFDPVVRVAKRPSWSHSPSAGKVSLVDP